MATTGSIIYQRGKGIRQVRVGRLTLSHTLSHALALACYCSALCSVAAGTMPLHRNASAQFKNGRRIDGSTGGKEKFTRLSVPVERGFNLGTLFGRNGATVDAIKRYTGVSVEVSLGEVVISGGNDGCKLAEAIVGDIQKGRCLAHDITCLRTIVMVEYDGERLTYYEGEGFDEDSVWYAENFLQELRQKENASMKKTKKTKKTRRR